MMPEGSVTSWLRRLQEGDREAVQPLWERYYPRLVALARGAAPLMPDGGSIIAMTYYGSEKVVPPAWRALCGRRWCHSKWPPGRRLHPPGGAGAPGW